MKSLLLNSCYPPAPPASQQAPSPLSSFHSLFSACTTAHGELPLAGPSCSTQPASTSPSSILEVATELPAVTPLLDQPWSRRCPTAPASTQEQHWLHGSRLFQEVEVH